MDARIYKICPAAAWREAERSGVLRLSAVDARDGFIHLSAAHQVRATAEKHFAGQGDLLLLAVEPAKLPQGALRWEPSRGGDLFPHLYGDLRPEHVAWAAPLERDAQGGFVFPALE
jgi:uncharacterized protein (DUF952 family)